MSPRIATRAFTVAFAALAALATISGTNALAGHEYRVAAAAQSAQPYAVASTQSVIIVGYRSTQL